MRRVLGSRGFRAEGGQVEEVVRGHVRHSWPAASQGINGLWVEGLGFMCMLMGRQRTVRRANICQGANTARPPARTRQQAPCHWQAGDEGQDTHASLPPQHRSTRNRLPSAAVRAHLCTHTRARARARVRARVGLHKHDEVNYSPTPHTRTRTHLQVLEGGRRARSGRPAAPLLHPLVALLHHLLILLHNKRRGERLERLCNKAFLSKVSLRGGGGGPCNWCVCACACRGGGQGGARGGEGKCAPGFQPMSRNPAALSPSPWPSSLFAPLRPKS